jgi:multidrug resistance efflux pump
MLRDIAQMSAQNVDLAERELQLRSRAATLVSLRPLAERHARESADVVHNLDSVSNIGLVTSQRLDQALGSRYDAASRLTGLQAESALLKNELPMVVSMRERAAETLNQLEAFYDKGQIRAERDGIVGPRVPSPGQVVKVGDELMQIYSGGKRVLAYLPDGYLFSVKPGDRVELTGRQGSADGVVDALLNVTDTLPPEFQSTFRPRDRGQLLRIRLVEDRNFAVSQKVRVYGCTLGWCWR